MLILSKQIYKVNTISIKTPGRYFVETKDYFKNITRSKGNRLVQQKWKCMFTLKPVGNCLEWLFHNQQNMKTIKISFNLWMNKYTIILPYIQLYLAIKRNQLYTIPSMILTCMIVSEVKLNYILYSSFYLNYLGKNWHWVMKNFYICSMVT